MEPSTLQLFSRGCLQLFPGASDSPSRSDQGIPKTPVGEVYEDYASKQQKYPRPHTDDVDPKRYMYRVETPPPTQTYTSAVSLSTYARARELITQKSINDSFL